MSDSILRQLRDHLSVADAAKELSKALGERISDADVLGLALEGHLRLSLYLPVLTRAACVLPDRAASRTYRDIDGLCDIPMMDFAKEEIEFRRQWLLGNFVNRQVIAGATVEKDGNLCSLRGDEGQSGMFPRGASAFPQGSVVCVRREVLDAFITKHRPPASPAVEETSKDRPLGTKERTTLLLMIDALAAKLGIQVEQASKAGGVIAEYMQERGYEYTAHAIANHLRELKKLRGGSDEPD